MIAKMFQNIKTLDTNVDTLISNQRISTPPVIDQIQQLAAAASHGTLYTITTYTGQGVLCAVGQVNAESSIDCYFDLTIDGTNETWDANEVISASTPFAGGTNSVIMPFGGIRFDTSLLVKMANDNAATQNITGVCVYGIGSVEYNREIIMAGEPIPAGTTYKEYYGTPYVIDERYNTDVMVITYLTEHGSNAGNLSTRVIFPKYNKVDILIDKNTGKISGRLKKPVFNLSPHMPHFNYEDCDEDCEQIIDVNGNKYKINVLGGIAQTNKIPPISINTNNILDAR